MIVKMKKVSVIMQAKDAKDSVLALRKLGILHIQNVRSPVGENLSKLKEDLALAEEALNILAEPAYLKVAPHKQDEALSDWRFAAKHTIELNKRLEQLGEYSRVLRGHISDWEAWGEFDPDDISALRQKNIFIKFYQVPAKEVKNIPQDIVVRQIFSRAGFIYCVVISQKESELPFKEIPLPKMGLQKMRTRLYEDERLKDLIVDDICSYLAYRKTLESTAKNLLKQIEFTEALAGMGNLGVINYLTGYIPAGQVATVEAAASRDKWGLLIEEPSEDEHPPVLLSNPRWVRLIEPVMKLLGIMPGYRELDVSPVFLIFFSMFFGILIGDAGYGIVYLLLTLWFQKKKGITEKNKNIFLLFYCLDSCAIIWGALTGTFFGQDWLTAKGIKPLIPALNDPGVMQTFCFFVGALHLSIAHAWRGVLKFPHSTFLAEIGWIAILWVAYFLAGSLILGKAFPEFAMPLVLCGIALVLFFSESRKNIFKRLGAGFTSVTFGLGFMSAFTDLVSYVRLFAVGLAAVAIANTTNAMAAGIGSGVFAIIAGVLITLIGHALNIVLGPIAILVHGVRLNVLEFGLNHTNLTWSGVAYSPLKETS